MGWTYTNRSDSQTDREFFTKEFSSCNIVDMSAPIKSTIYVVLENKKALGDLFAVVILTQWCRKDHYNFGYKDIEECMGPYSYDCPIRLLDLLSPTESEYANEWRKLCREQAKKTASIRKKMKMLKPGVVIRFPEPLKFTNRRRLREFKVEQYGKKKLFRDTTHHDLYRIRRLSSYDFEICTEESCTNT